MVFNGRSLADNEDKRRGVPQDGWPIIFTAAGWQSDVPSLLERISSGAKHTVVDQNGNSSSGPSRLWGLYTGRPSKSPEGASQDPH